jgi:hypothetical protein
VEPAHQRFGGGAAETVLHPLVAVWLLIAIVLILGLPRRRVITPFLLSFFTIPIGQVLVLGGVHFTALRILILVVLIRMAVSLASSSEIAFAGGFNGLDRLTVLWSLAGPIIFSLQWMEKGAFVAALGDLIDGFGCYLAVRFLIPDGETIRRAVKVLAAVCLTQGADMISEQYTRLNIFALVGGMVLHPDVRNGQVRSEGTLGSLYGGVFAGILIPLFVWLWTQKKSRLAACAGIFGATAMVYTSHSSTSFLAWAGSLVGLAFWPFRKRMRLVRWGFGLTIVGIQAVMKAPIWALIGRIDLTGASSSYQRYMLVDNCLRHFGEWWLLGTKYYNDWGLFMFDVCNQFVWIAVRGGLLTLVLYVMMHKWSFAAIGDARKRIEGDYKQEWLLWCLGAGLWANITASFGVSYLAQLQGILLPLLACIAVASFEAREATVQGTEIQDQSRFASAPRAGRTRPLLGETG